MKGTPMKKRLAAAALAIAAVAGLTLTTTTPAQAFPGFAYTAYCPDGADVMVLRVENASGSSITTTAFRQWSWGYDTNVLKVVTTKNGYITEMHVYAEMSGANDVRFWFNGAGSLNWWYSASCRYL